MWSAIYSEGSPELERRPARDPAGGAARRRRRRQRVCASVGLGARPVPLAVLLVRLGGQKVG